MKRFRFLTVLMAVALLAGCKSQPQEPTALDVIMTRTSIRSFTGDPVSREQLETILKAGMAAPSAINIQPWSCLDRRISCKRPNRTRIGST